MSAKGIGKSPAVQLPKSEAFSEVNEAATQILNDPARNPAPLVALLEKPLDAFLPHESNLADWRREDDGWVTCSFDGYKDGTMVVTQEYKDDRAEPVRTAINARDSYVNVGQISGLTPEKPVYNISIEGPPTVSPDNGVEFSKHFIEAHRDPSGALEVRAGGKFSPFDGADAIWSGGSWSERKAR